jgi:uncharacterized protein (TIGR03437 family)
MPTQVFAGIVVLLNHYLVANKAQSKPGVGNINPTLYHLAQSAPTAFHDVTAGNNFVECGLGTPNCTSGQLGYSAGPGFDLVTGLGSVDVYNLVTQWNATPTVSTTTTLTANPTSFLAGAGTILTATVSAGAGAATPTGSVFFTLGNTVLATANLSGSGASATAVVRASGSQLAAGNNSITASYGGATGFGASSASVTVTVGAPVAIPSISGVQNAASFQNVYAPGMAMSVYGTNLANSTQTAYVLPLPLTMAGVSATVNGVAAPLYYVSPGQLNIQIPYETAVGTALLAVNGATYSFPVSASAPGIYMGAGNAIVPNPSGSRGQIYTLFVTGAGQVSPPVSTGAAPAGTQAPTPLLSVSMTIGGIAAPTDYIGIPSWSVGTVQINFTVPPNAPVGVQPVVVTVGSASSAAANFTVQ